MALRVIYRSYGGENKKDRPDYYSKLLCLVSFIRAAEAANATVVFMNDGPVPEDRLRLMEKAGEVITLDGVGMRGSYLAALRLATSSRWDRDDFVWFSEDDYLYLPNALVHLDRATAAISEADYFALYGPTPSRPPLRFVENPPRRPAGWRDHAPWIVDEHAWVRTMRTTSTFGGRVGALIDDFGIFRLCMIPHRKMYRDDDISLVYQGFEPYSYRQLARDAVGKSSGPVRERLREAWLSPFRVMTNLRAHRRAERRRVLVSPDPNLATHMEDGWLAPGTDWAAIASDTQRWAQTRGVISETPAS